MSYTDCIAFLYRNSRQENENIDRENVFFLRYLLRINTRKIVERFDEYEDENANDIILEILNQAKLADATQRLASKSFR
jgi:hypothetical protein